MNWWVILLSRLLSCSPSVWDSLDTRFYQHSFTSTEAFPPVSAGVLTATVTIVMHVVGSLSNVLHGAIYGDSLEFLVNS